MNKKIHTILVYANVARPICAIMLGHGHSHIHRMTAGVFIMGVGVTIAKLAHGIEFTVIQMLVDGVGYGIHGLGLTPFIEVLSERYNASRDVLNKAKLEVEGEP